jgi:hypothetical protein
MLFTKTPTHIYQQLDGGAPSWVSETEDWHQPKTNL